MKKIIIVSLIAFMGLFVTVGADAKINDINDAYKIMVDAKKDKRILTSDESAVIEAATKSLIMFNSEMSEKEKNLHRALSAMYMNYNVDCAFYEAKSNYDKLDAN